MWSTFLDGQRRLYGEVRIESVIGFDLRVRSSPCTISNRRASRLKHRVLRRGPSSDKHPQSERVDSLRSPRQMRAAPIVPDKTSVKLLPLTGAISMLDPYFHVLRTPTGLICRQGN